MDYREFISDTLLDIDGTSVEFSRFEDDIIANVTNKGSITIALNDKFKKDLVWTEKIKKSVINLVPDIFEKAEELDMDIIHLILLYLCFSADYGHLDPDKGGDMQLSKFSSYEYKRLWLAVSKELDDQMS